MRLFYALAHISRSSSRHKRTHPNVDPQKSSLVPSAYCDGPQRENLRLIWKLELARELYVPHQELRSIREPASQKALEAV